MQKLHLKKNLQSAGMILGLSAMLFSCSEVISGNDDNPVAPQKTENEKVEFTSTGAKITAESASEATTLFLTLVEDIKTKGVGEGKEYVIDIVGSNVQSGSDISLTVPMVVGANLNLRFEKAFNEGTTLTINASETSSDSKESVNKLAITIPSADKLSLNVNMPETTVTLKSPEGVTTYRDVVSRTATNTLIVDEGVTGYGYEFGNIDDLERVLNDIANEPERVTDLKANCIKKAKDYSLERLESDLLKYIS